MSKKPCKNIREALIEFFDVPGECKPHTNNRRLVLLPYGMGGADAHVLMNVMIPRFSHVLDPKTGEPSVAPIDIRHINDTEEAVLANIDQYLTTLTNFDPANDYVSVLILGLTVANMSDIRKRSTDEHNLQVIIIPSKKMKYRDFYEGARVYYGCNNTIYGDNFMTRSGRVLHNTMFSPDLCFKNPAKLLYHFFKRYFDYVRDETVDAITEFVYSTNLGKHGVPTFGSIFSPVWTNLLKDNPKEYIPHWAMFSPTVIHTLVYNYSVRQDSFDQYIDMMSKRIWDGVPFVNEEVKNFIIAYSHYNPDDEEDTEEESATYLRCKEQAKAREISFYERELEDILESEIKVFRATLSNIASTLENAGTTDATFAKVGNTKLILPAPGILVFKEFEGDHSYEDEAVHYLSTIMKVQAKRGCRRHIYDEGEKDRIVLLNGKNPKDGSVVSCEIVFAIIKYDEKKNTVKVWNTCTSGFNFSIWDIMERSLITEQMANKAPYRMIHLKNIAGNNVIRKPHSAVFNIDDPDGTKTKAAKKAAKKKKVPEEKTTNKE